MNANLRSRSARNLCPTVDGLEGRKLLSSVSFLKLDMDAVVSVAVAPPATGGHLETSVFHPLDLNPQPLPPGIMKAE